MLSNRCSVFINIMRLKPCYRPTAALLQLLKKRHAFAVAEEEPRIGPQHVRMSCVDPATLAHASVPYDVVAVASYLALQAFLDDVHQRLLAAPDAFKGML
jgi:hypothetical protein